MTAPTIVETDRLLLRNFVPGDAEAMFELCRDPRVMRYVGGQCLTSAAEAEAMIRERPMADYRKYGFGRWAVVLKADGRLFGMTGLKYLPELDEVDLGYRFLPEYWGRGLATEAGRASVRYGFEKLKLPRIIGLVNPENVGSIRVLEKCGLAFESMVEYMGSPAARYVVHAPSGQSPREEIVCRG